MKRYEITIAHGICHVTLYRKAVNEDQALVFIDAYIVLCIGNEDFHIAIRVAQ